MMWWREQPFRLGGSTQAHLKVQGLSAGYGPFLVLRDLTLEARPGLTVILGPNGAGKTTLLKALAGLIPMRGIVTLDGDDLSVFATTSQFERTADSHDVTTYGKASHVFRAGLANGTNEGRRHSQSSAPRFHS